MCVQKNVVKVSKNIVKMNLFSHKALCVSENIILRGSTKSNLMCSELILVLQAKRLLWAVYIVCCCFELLRDYLLLDQISKLSVWKLVQFEKRWDCAGLKEDSIDLRKELSCEQVLNFREKVRVECMTAKLRAAEKDFEKMRECFQV